MLYVWVILLILRWGVRPGDLAFIRASLAIHTYVLCTNGVGIEIKRIGLRIGI